MQANSDGTLAIYTSTSGETNERQLYTEIPIPFTAIHGMQTRGKEECDFLSIYSENVDEMREHDFGQEAFYSQPSHSFVEEVISRKISGQLLVATFAAAALQFLVGYNVVILNNPEKYVFPGHSVTAWSAAVAALAIGAPLGAAIGSRLSEDQGRWKTLMYAGLMFLFGGVVQTFAPSLMVLAGARFVIGVASGVSTVVVPIYLGEVSPARLRGTLGTVNQFAFVIGILAAFLLSFGFATEEGWRYLLLMTVFVSLVQLLLLSQVPESPRWLLQENPHDPSAQHILQNLRVSNDMDALKVELQQYRGAPESKGAAEQPPNTLMEQVMEQEHTRYLFFCLIFLHCSQQLSGISAVFYYSTSLFEGVIGNPLIVTTLIGSVNVIFTYIALLLMDRCRRKSLLLWSFGGMLCSCACLVLSHMGILPGSVSIVAVNTYIAFYEIGVGPIPWLIIAEVFDAKYVTAIMSVCSQLSWIVNFFVSLLFPSLNDILGEYTFIPFGGMLLLSFLFTWQMLPETQGKTPDQIASDVIEKLSSDEDVSNDPNSTSDYHPMDEKV